ncbi:hypothetical protein [Haloferax sp. YSMS24]|uniref:hypothetical protein n=1 Tax=Haloferax sp. YSMS24 TaxID=3388425 RepID=UPI00398CD5F5
MAIRSGRTMLTDMDGSGDNVFVIATVTKTWSLASHKPFQKGFLTDPSKAHEEERYFVVYDPDVRLEEGKTYKLNGTDYAYEPFEEIQLKLNEGAFVEEWEWKQ